jgi:hypothetical protein
MRATDIERAILTGRYPQRTEETRRMPTQIEMHAWGAQIEAAKQLDRIATALGKIADSLALIEAQMPIDRERADDE